MSELEKREAAIIKILKSSDSPLVKIRELRILGIDFVVAKILVELAQVKIDNEKVKS